MVVYSAGISFQLLLHTVALLYRRAGSGGGDIVFGRGFPCPAIAGGARFTSGGQH